MSEIAEKRITENWFFIRGLIRESGHWHNFVRQFEERYPHRRVLFLDLLGNGEHFRAHTPCSVSALASQLRQDFLVKREAHPAEKNYLFALSLGAMACIDWLSHFPLEADGAVLMNTSSGGLSPFYRRMRPRNYFSVLRLFFASDPLTIEKEILHITSNAVELHAAVAEAWSKIHVARPVSRGNALRQIWAASRFRAPATAPGVKILLLSSHGDQLVHSSCTEKISEAWRVPTRFHASAGHDLTLDAPKWVLDQLSLAAGSLFEL